MQSEVSTAGGGPAEMFEESFIRLRTDQLVAAKDNPRRNVGDVTELAETIKVMGILEPLIVAPLEDSTYQVIAGHRRLAAAELAEQLHVPCLIRVMTDQQRLEAMLVENMHRENLDPIEEARAYEQLEKSYHVKQRDLAARVGRSQSHISKRVSLLKLPKKVHDQLDSGGITIKQAEMLLPLRAHPERIKKVLGHPSYYSFESAAKQELEDLRDETERKKQLDELEASDVRVLPWQEYIESDVFQAVGKGWSDLDVDLEAHKSEPCHAATIRGAAGHVMYICTEPARHAADGDSELKAPEEQQRSRVAGVARIEDPEEEARFDALVQREQMRHDFVKRYLLGPHVSDQHASMLLTIVMTNPRGWFDELYPEDVCKWLDLEADNSTEQEPTFDGDEAAADALARFASENPAGATRIATAMAITAIEQDLGIHARDWSHYRPYFEWLAESRHGTEWEYKASEVELAMLEPPKAEEDQDHDDDFTYPASTCPNCGREVPVTDAGKFASHPLPDAKDGSMCELGGTDVPAEELEGAAAS